MAKTVLYMSMSLDGFIDGSHETIDRLHSWFFSNGDDLDLETTPDRLGGVNGQVFRELMDTGAVVAGRGTFEPAKGWGGDHHAGVPIYILSRHTAPDWAADWPLVHYVDDIGLAMREASREAGEREVLVHGASIARFALAQGALDEIEIHLVPVLLGAGRLLFDHLGLGPRELERVRVLEGENGITHLRYRVRR